MMRTPSPPKAGTEQDGIPSGEVRVERCGKSAPIGSRVSDAVNSIRSNTAGEHEAGPAVLRRWLERSGNRPPR